MPTEKSLLKKKEILLNKIGKNDVYSRLENSIKSSGDYLYNHSFRVSETARSICVQLGLDDKKTVSTVVASRLHDIGLANFFLMKEKKIIKKTF